MRYDLIVIGSDRPGVDTAIAAARCGRRTALICDLAGGRNASEAIVQDAIRGLAVDLATDAMIGGRPHSTRSAGTHTMDELRDRLDAAVDREQEQLRWRLEADCVDLIDGRPVFLDEHTIAVHNRDGKRHLVANSFVVATGMTPAHREPQERAAEHMVTPRTLFELRSIPGRMIVIGTTRAGLDQAALLAAFGAEVTVINRTRDLDPFPAYGADWLAESSDIAGLEIRSGEDVIGIDQPADSWSDAAGLSIHLSGGEQLVADVVLSAEQETGNTESLKLDAAGLMTDDRGQLWCDENLRTWQPHIFGAGKVVGFPQMESDRDDAGRILSAMLESDSRVPRPLAVAARTGRYPETAVSTSPSSGA